MLTFQHSFSSEILTFGENANKSDHTLVLNESSI